MATEMEAIVGFNLLQWLTADPCRCKTPGCGYVDRDEGQRTSPSSVNRAMPGSYYSDVERTIYLTYYILVEVIAKYDELFQQVNICAGAFLLTEYFVLYYSYC
jgi:hypothetical protein